MWQCKWKFLLQCWTHSKSLKHPSWIFCTEESVLRKETDGYCYYGIWTNPKRSSYTIWTWIQATRVGCRYGLNVCVPSPKSTCWNPTPQSDSSWSWGLWVCLDHEGRASVNGISSLSLSLLSLGHMRTSGEGGCLQATKRILITYWFCWNLNLRLSAIRTVRNKCWSHPVYGIFVMAAWTKMWTTIILFSLLKI